MKKYLALVMSAAFIAGCGGDNPSTAVPAAMKQSGPQALAIAPVADYKAVVQQLYIAYFGRPADPAGLTNFENALLAAGAPGDIQGLVAAYGSNAALQSLINSFGASKESQNLYGTGNTAAFVTAVFNNVLGRAPQAAGLNYWVAAIDAPGGLSRGNAAVAIMAGALANNTAQGVLDAQLIRNRLAIAGTFTAQVASQNAISLYAGAAAAAAARSLLSAVSAATDLNAYAAAVNAAVTALGTVPPVSSLCTSTNFTLAKFNAIAEGMTRQQVNQVIGCQFEPALTQRTSEFVAYSWSGVPSGSIPVFIMVFFDASGEVVRSVSGSGSFKNSSGLLGAGDADASLPVCSAANFTTTKYNAITLGMTLAQVGQAIGCRYDPSLTQRTATYVAYSWSGLSTGSMSNIMVFFDASGTIVAGPSGSPSFKLAIGF